MQRRRGKEVITFVKKRSSRLRSECGGEVHFWDVLRTSGPRLCKQGRVENERCRKCPLLPEQTAKPEF